MTMTRVTNSAMGRTPARIGLRFAIAVVAVIGVAGCSSTPSSPSATASAVPSTTASAIASPTATSSATPTPTPTPARPLSFVATGSMHVAREYATATLLKNGKVLIAGGYSRTDLFDNYYASAEIYDPATGKFSKTGSMTAARGWATAIRLSDGRVLIAGGEGCPDPNHCTKAQEGLSQNLASAEIYDPATGKFTLTGSMTASGRSEAPVLLPDGKVMMPFYGPAAELFDPATGKFTGGGHGVAAGPDDTATLLPNGKVLATGAAPDPQLYDVATGKFTKVSLVLPPGTPTAKYQDAVVDRKDVYTATLLKDGRVLLFEDGYLETYDPATGACADAGFISPGGQWDYPMATLLADGRVLFEGGALPSQDPMRPDPVNTNVAVVYDPSNGQVSTGAMHTARAGQTATLLPNGSVLIAGGADANYNAVASAELFKP